MALKAGDILPLPFTLETSGGSKVSYANATALIAAGWTFEYWIGGVQVLNPTYTWATVNAAAGQGEVYLTLQYGKGTVYLRPPTGYVANLQSYDVDVENTSLDVLAAKIDASAGTPSPDDRRTSTDYTIVEGDSFLRSITVPSDVLADFGLSDLSTVTSSSGAARTRINRLDTLPDFTFNVFVLDAVALTLAIGWQTFPTGAGIGSFAITGVSTSGKTFTVAGDKRKFFDGITKLLLANSTGNDGYYTLVSMALSAGNTVFTVSETVADATADGAIGQGDDTKDFLYDVQIQFPLSYAVTAVNTGTKKLTIAGDKRRFFSVGGTFAIAGSTGNDATYTVAALTLTGGNTVITVVEVVPSAVADGTISVTQKVTTNDGTFTITRQEDRT